MIFNPDAIENIEGTYPICVDIERGIARIWLDGPNSIYAKLTDIVPDVEDSEGVLRTAYRWTKQEPAAGGTFADSTDNVTGYDSGAVPPTWPAFSVSGQAVVGDVVKLYPGYRDNRTDLAENYSIEWFFWPESIGISVLEGVNALHRITSLTFTPDEAWTLTGTSPNATINIEDASAFNSGIVNRAHGQIMGLGGKWFGGGGFGFGGAVGLLPASLGVPGIGIVNIVDAGCTFVGGSIDGAYGDPTVTITSYGIQLKKVTAPFGASVDNLYLATGISESDGYTFTNSTGTYSDASYTEAKATFRSPYSVFGELSELTWFYMAEGGASVHGIYTRSLYADITAGAMGFGVMNGSVFKAGKTLNSGGLQFEAGLLTGGTVSVNLNTEVTNTLSVGNGGTGAITLDASKLIQGNGTSPVSSVSDTRIASGKLELNIGADRWIAFSLGNH